MKRYVTLGHGKITKGDIVCCFECGTPLRAFTACPKCNPPVPDPRP